MKTDIVLDISRTYLAKCWASSYRWKCCQPISLQDSLKCKKEVNYEVYYNCMQIEIAVFGKVILSLSVTRRVQSTQNKFAYLCNISIKAWAMKLSFCLQINTNVFYKMIVSHWVYLPRQSQSTKNNISRKTWRVKLVFSN